MKRRSFLKSTLACSAIAVAASTGLLKPQHVLANWNISAFQARTIDRAIAALFGASKIMATNDIRINTKGIAENGSLVPVKVITRLSNVTDIAILASKNNQPLAAYFKLEGRDKGNVATHIKLVKTCELIAVVKAGGKLYSTRKSVKVSKANLCVARKKEIPDYDQRRKLRSISIETLSGGYLTGIKARITHPMETGLCIDKLTGKKILPHFITQVKCEHMGNTVFSAQLGPWVSRNPFLFFTFHGGNIGETVKLSWVDNMGKSDSSEVKIT